MFSCYPCVNQDVAKQVRGYKKRYIQIEKPPTCKLDEGTYRLMSEPEGDIKPEVCPCVCMASALYCITWSCAFVITQLNLFKLCSCVSVQDLKFTLAVTKMKGYFEAFFEQPPPFKLSLRDTNTEETVWSATIREGNNEFSLTLRMLGDLQVKVLFCVYCRADSNRNHFNLLGDCVNNVEKKPRKRTSSTSLVFLVFNQIVPSQHALSFYRLTHIISLSLIQADKGAAVPQKKKRPVKGRDGTMSQVTFLVLVQTTDLRGTLLKVKTSPCLSYFWMHLSV